MTTTEILDKIYPYTNEETRCCQKRKRQKMQKRQELAILINKYRQGRAVNFARLGSVAEKVKELLQNN